MSEFRFEVWPTEHKFITQHFGARPLFYAQFDLPGHEGVDFQAPVGGKIFCVAPGTVRHVFRDDDERPYGTDVRVEHSGGYETIYAHLQEATVEEGQTLKAGDLIGIAGESGNVDGPHLHLTLKHHNGEQSGYPNHIVDPTPYLLHLLDPTWDDAKYVRDTIPDGTVVRTNENFVQTWFMRNTGATTWGIGYQLRHIGGDPLGAPTGITAPPAPPNAEVPISLTFHAPAAAGRHRSTWRLCDPDNNFFGDPIWVEIEVPASQVTSPGPIPDHFIQPRGTQFILHGQPFRFFGLNLRGLIHYGRRHADPLRFSRLEHRQSQLQEAQRIGARVVRLFLPDKDTTPVDIEQRLREVLDIVKAHFPDLYLLPVFTNLYNDVPFHVPGDASFFARRCP